MTKIRTQPQHQKDMLGCGVACIANLLQRDYDRIKKDFEKKFYTIERGIKATDLARYLFKHHGRSYQVRFFNLNPKHRPSAASIRKLISVPGTIVLIAKNKKYPVGHYLLRTSDGWVDPWHNYPSIHNVHAKVRSTLPGRAWYAIYPTT